MSLRIPSLVFGLVGWFATSPSLLIAQQPVVKTAAVSKAQAVIDQAGEDGKFTFVLFYKQNDTATAAMNTTLQQTLLGDDDAVVALVQVGNPAEQALVAKHDVARAPMPMTLVLAPNGAITGLFAKRLTAANIEEAFVTPTMMSAMKSLQEGKLVFVTAQGQAQAPAVPALKDFQADPHFKNRIVTLSMQVTDPQEEKFVGQMKLDPQAKASQVVLLAPPGVLVGKFAPTASKDEIAAMLAKAGKCCDDENCKHHHHPQATGPKGAMPKPATPKTALQGPATTRKK